MRQLELAKSAGSVVRVAMPMTAPRDLPSAGATQQPKVCPSGDVMFCVVMGWGSVRRAEGRTAVDQDLRTGDEAGRR